MHTDMSAIAFMGGMLARFWAKLFSRFLVAEPGCRRFNRYAAQQNHAGKRPEKWAQIGGSPGRTLLRLAAYNVFVGGKP